MNMSELLNYTRVNRRRVESIVSLVNSLKDECENITSDKNTVELVYFGRKVRMTKEEAAFLEKTQEFRKRLRDGESISDIMGEALSVVREAIKRRLGMFAYDTQIEAAAAMLGSTSSERVIAEMKTGEGKTLVQMLVAYLNLLEATMDENPKNWKGVHIMTSNDALAKRDADHNRSVFNLLGFSCGFVPSRRSVKGKSQAERNIYKNQKKQAYMCDVVYATASTIAFDYLDDNTVIDVRQRNINKKFGYAIVDEADDLLLDQAINPLKISGRPVGYDTEYESVLQQSEKFKKEVYKWATEFLYGKKGVRIRGLKGKVFDRYSTNKNAKPDDYAYYMDTMEVVFSDEILREIGIGIDDEEIYNYRYVALMDCIKAKHSYLADREYKVQIDRKNHTAEIVLIDQNIGRKRYSNKYNDGMQEAIEAKEQYLENDSPLGKQRYVIEQTANQTVRAMCTYPDFMGLYEGHVCGMTGTSDSEEFKELYGFETYQVPTRKKNIRVDMEDELYATKRQKHSAILKEVLECKKTGQPVLIGTTSIEESLIISSILASNNIRHQLLNADNEEVENQIIESAGMMGCVTVATNMAGRGTDIKLGEGVRELGGLYVIGTSKNKSSRIDMQLRGRSGRQGDPGKTKYFSSLEDDLIRQHYSNALQGLIDVYKTSDSPIKNKKCIKAANRAQEMKDSKDKLARRTTEQVNKVFSEHRKIIYENRNAILESTELEFMNRIKSIISKYVDGIVETESESSIESLLGHLIDVKKCISPNIAEFKKNLKSSLFNRLKSNFNVGKISASEMSKYISETKVKLLHIIDIYWNEHIQVLNDVKNNVIIGSVGDPIKDYERFANEKFANELIPAIYNEMLTYALDPSITFGSYIIKSQLPPNADKIIL